MKKWYGITYPVPTMFQNNFFWTLWSKFMCPHGWHLLDEVSSAERHYLYCDACEISIDLAD